MRHFTTQKIPKIFATIVLFDSILYLILIHIFNQQDTHKIISFARKWITNQIIYKDIAHFFTSLSHRLVVCFLGLIHNSFSSIEK